MTEPHRVRLRVGTLRLSGGSAAGAHQLAEALPAALTRALASWPDPPDRRTAAAGTAAERAAARVAAEVAARVIQDATSTAEEASS